MRTSCQGSRYFEVCGRWPICIPRENKRSVTVFDRPDDSGTPAGNAGSENARLCMCDGLGIRPAPKERNRRPAQTDAPETPSEMNKVKAHPSGAVVARSRRFAALSVSADASFDFDRGFPRMS